MNRSEALAWSAGMVDGDGSWQGHPSPRSPSLVVTQNREEIPQELLRLQEALGFGRIDGPYFREGRKPNWRYVAQGYEKFQAAIAMLWPWMGEEKRRQAHALAIRYHRG